MNSRIRSTHSQLPLESSTHSSHHSRPPRSSRGKPRNNNGRNRMLGDLRGGLAAGLLTLVSTIACSAVAGAPLGPSLAAMAVLAGLAAAALGGTVAAWFGALPTQVFAPRASVAVVIATAVTTFAGEHANAVDATARTLVMLAMCLLIASVLQLGLGLMRLGGLIRLIPHPVTAGLTIAIALKLLWSQGPLLLGNPGMQSTDWLAPVLTGAATLAAIGWAQWRGHRTYAMVAGLIAGVVVAHGTSAQPMLAPVQWIDGPLLLPALLRMIDWLPHLHLLASPNVFAFAFVIALINSMETLTSTLTLEEAVAQRYDANQALMAGALGSLAAVCLGGFPVAGGAAASVANARAGGRTRLSALLVAFMVITIAAGFGSAIAGIPLAAVAAIMIMVAVGLATPPLIELAQQWQRRYDDPYRVCGELTVAALVGLLMLFVGMLAALAVGVLLSTWLALFHMRASLVRQRYDANEMDLMPSLRARISTALGRTIHVIEIGQPLFFATVETLLRMIEEPAGSVRFVLVDLRRVGGMDATAARSLARCAAVLHAAERYLVVVRPNQSAAIDHALGGYPAFDDLEAALHYCVDQADYVPAPPPVAPASVHSELIAEGELGRLFASRTPVRPPRAAAHAKRPRDARWQLGMEAPDSVPDAARSSRGSRSKAASAGEGDHFNRTLRHALDRAKGSHGSDFAPPPTGSSKQSFRASTSEAARKRNAPEGSRDSHTGPSSESMLSFGDEGDSSFRPGRRSLVQVLARWHARLIPAAARSTVTQASQSPRSSDAQAGKPPRPQALLPRGAMAPAIAMVSTIAVAASAIVLVGLHWHPVRTLNTVAPVVATSQPPTLSNRMRTGMANLENTALSSCPENQAALGLCVVLVPRMSTTALDSGTH